jgi:hypothetical protein
MFLWMKMLAVQSSRESWMTVLASNNPASLVTTRHEAYRLLLTSSATLERSRPLLLTTMASSSLERVNRSLHLRVWVRARNALVDVVVLSESPANGDIHDATSTFSSRLILKNRN